MTLRMKNKWRVTIYVGLKGNSDNPEIFDEVHVTSNEDLHDAEIRHRAMGQLRVYPKTHHMDIVRIK